MKGALLVLFAVLVLAHAAKSEDDLVIRNDPYMDRIVREALDIGENSLIESALTPAASGIFMPLEDSKDLQASLLSVSEDILGKPVDKKSTVTSKVSLPVAAPLETPAPSLLETNSFTDLLTETEDAVAREARIIEEKKEKLRREAEQDKELLSKVDKFSSTVDNFEAVLEDKKPVDPVASFLALEAEAEQVEAESPALIEAALDSEASAESESESSTESESESESESEAEESSFLELDNEITTHSETSFASALAQTENPSASVEILEPTRTEELAAEAEGATDLPNLSFLMTDEELQAQLDELSKSSSQKA